MKKFTNNIPTTVKGAFRRMLPFMSQFHNSTVEKVADEHFGERVIYRAYTLSKCYEFEKDRGAYYCWDVTSADDRKIVTDGIPTALYEIVEHFNQK